MTKISQKKRVFFVNRFFSPDHSATSQILTDLAFHLAKTREVHVVTSNQIYDDPQRRLPDEETIENVQIHRVATTKFGRANLIGRFFDYLSIYWAFRRKLNSLVEPGDILVAKTDPPLLSVIVARAARRKGATLINWLQDIYPEVAVELGVIPSAIAGALTALRDRSLRQAKFNVVLGENMAKKVAKRNASANSIVIIPNWCNDKVLHPIEHENNILRTQWDLRERFVVGYSGNLGRAHEYQTALDAAESLVHRPDIVFLMIGGGHGLEKLKAQIEKRKLAGKFLFKPYQQRELLANSLAVSDVHWVSLLPNLEGLIVPSKIYGILAAGRPLLAITSRESDVAAVVDQFECGYQIAPGNGTELAGLVEELANNPEKVRTLGIQARNCLISNFTMDQALTKWSDLLDTVE